MTEHGVTVELFFWLRVANRRLPVNPALQANELPSQGLGMVCEAELADLETWRSELYAQYHKEGEEMQSAIVVTSASGDNLAYRDAFIHLRRIVCEGPSSLRAGERFEQLGWEHSGTFVMTASGSRNIQLTADDEGIAQLIVDKEALLAALDQACARATALAARITAC